jgi:Ribbon-helix-helix protein, copG family
MAKSTNFESNTVRRLVAGKDPLVATRMAPALIAKIDKWAKRNDTSRPEAIRQLVELAVASSQPQKRTSKKSAARASSMAAREIDDVQDQSTSYEMRVRRKRRLLRGPAEFRDMRKD